MFPEGVAASIESMATLNRRAAEVATQYTIHSCTDITGFGLLGHAYEMAAGSGVAMKIKASTIPLLPEAAEAATIGLVPAGAYARREYLTTVCIDSSVPVAIQDLCFDPQTSGGLLLSVPYGEAEALLRALQQGGTPQARMIGEVIEGERGEIYVY
ncbi:Selenide, water dikinase 1 (fragment) [Candidatus Desulfosporosinus infrequens]|uniref:Selenide, water dikinase 1 n=1 Tax=Candidatus Desulfosporosinus infrequens TaxID=2043169 RepID=A0A2U3LPG5_9FIRM